MADTSGILKIGLVAGAAWAAWQFFLKPSTATAATPQPGTAPTPSVVPFNTPDQIYQRLVMNLNQNPQFKANPSAFTATPYDFKFYLDQVTQVPSGLDFSKMFPAQVNPDGSNSATPNLTLGQFWSAMAPWLAKNIPGMTGFRGLAGIIAGGRR